MIKINENINIHYPLTLKPREQQLQAMKFIQDNINTGNKYCLAGLPTGSGKSYLVSMFANWYTNHVNKSAKFDIITNSKILQKQYIRDYSVIKNFEGRANYICEPHDTNCHIGADICRNREKCDDCPYQVAKKAWQISDISLTNFHLYNTMALYATHILNERESNVLIIDEAHSFEEVFCSFITTNICSKALKKYGFDFKEIEDYERQICRIKKIDQFIGFVKNQFLSDIDAKMDSLNDKMENESKKLKLEYSKYKLHCESEKVKFLYLVQEYDNNPTNWILESSTEKNKITLEAKPIWSHMYIKEKIFDKYDHVLLMSGTILNSDLFTFINGIDPKLTTFMELPTPFNIKRHPIYYIKCGKMTWTEKENTFKTQLEYIDKILKKSPNKKGIIHTSNYELSKWIEEKYINKRLLFHTPENREEILNVFMSSDQPLVMVSPSMISGVDFRYEASQFQIIIKIPFPSLASESIKMRIKTNDKWYNWRTVCDLMQMYGRSFRDYDDWCETFILDSSFSDILKHGNELFPRWFTDSIKVLKI